MLIGVLGAGTMGGGIAEVAAQVGQVVLIDVDEALAEAGRKAIEKRLNRRVERGSLSKEQRDEILGRIAVSADWGDLKKAAVVVEAASEDLAVKREIFEALGRICSADCLLGTNTSALSITDLAVRTVNPPRVLGIHFFNPVSRMELVELVVTDFTSKESLAKARRFVESLQKTAVLVKESPGFVVNRLLLPMINEAVFLLSEGTATAEDIDTALRLGANHPLGPLALADLIGLDICLAIMETLQAELGEDKYRPAPLLRKMVRAGRLGRKTKAGFYAYD